MADVYTSSVLPSVIPNGRKRNDKPEMRDLLDTVIPQHASRWKELGYRLGLEGYAIDNINCDHNQVQTCCTAMLQKWLEMTPSSSWGELDDAIQHLITGHDQLLKSPKRVRVDVVNSGLLNVISEKLTKWYIEKHFTPRHDDWPPDQPKEYTTLALIHYRKKPSQKQIIGLARVKFACMIDQIISSASSQSLPQESTAVEGTSNSIDECLQESRITHNISDILVPFENPDHDSKVILVEGAPGLGKTILLKQIAYEWASKKLLFNSKLVFLLPLRDPAVWNMSSVKDLVRYFYWESFEDCAASIEDTAGKGVTILLDGYDEYPVELQKCSFIADIINHNVLPLSVVMISSRPYATIHLRKNITCYVDILGFTKEHQQSFFEKSLESQPDKLQELKIYLEDHPTISSLCYIPFNMTVLVWLFKEEIAVPNSLAELYNCFICNTIYRDLKQRQNLFLDNITSLRSFPSPYSEVIQQISALCLRAIITNQLVFSLDEIEKVCPLINSVPGAINCFGLLQVTSHYSDGIGTPTKTVNFVHFSIQEFFAAYRITCLPENEEYEFIRANFFSEFYSNTIALYVGITKGQRDSFKRFLRYLDSWYYKVTNAFGLLFGISNESAKRRYLRLFHCFNEANDIAACNVIAEKLHHNKCISVIGSPLYPSDVDCLALLLSNSPNKSWEILYLYYCYIQDIGLQILHKSLLSSKVVINWINLRGNLLTSKSMQLIEEIAISCEISVLDISCNTLEDGEWLEKITGNSSTLRCLHIYNNKLLSSGAIRLFCSLRTNRNTRLKVLDIGCNVITDEAVSEIREFLEQNTSLVDLVLRDNDISEESKQLLMKSRRRCVLKF